jgi:outer membrane protein OmpA-like peptidoglycan-associated protein
MAVSVFTAEASQHFVYRGAKVVVPKSENPDAIIKKEVRWYRFDVKEHPNACKYERPVGVCPECDKWYEANMPADAEKPKRIIVLEGINFDFDKYSIREDSEPILKDNIRDLTEFWIMKIKIIGHTDFIGTNKYNQKLSENRAKR